MTKANCSIIIRSYNEEKHIGRLLSGIMEQTVNDVEVILVDSGSTDATLAIASRFPVKILSISPDLFTFGRSLNTGCAAASASFLVFASAHVYPVYPDWLECLLSPFSDPKVALTYGRQRGGVGTRYSERQHFSKLYPGTSDLNQRIPFCNNANAAVRRDLWAEHPYDEQLPGLEDLEWASWALRQGHRLAYVSEAEIIHIHEETPKQVYNRYRREAMAMKQIRPEEHFHIWDFSRLYLANVASDLLRAARERVLLDVIWEVLWFRAMQFLGTLRGFSDARVLSSDLKRAFYYPISDGNENEPPDRELEPIDYGQLGKGLVEASDG